MMTERPIISPEGVDVVEWVVPRGHETAVVTSRLTEACNVVIWAHCGVFCSGVDFDSTFGLIHTAEKSAGIWVKVYSYRQDKLRTTPVEGSRDLQEAFQVTLDERFLHEKQMNKIPVMTYT